MVVRKCVGACVRKRGEGPELAESEGLGKAIIDRYHIRSRNSNELLDQRLAFISIAGYLHTDLDFMYTNGPLECC